MELNQQNKEELVILLKNLRDEHQFIVTFADHLCMFRTSAKQVADLVTAHFISESQADKKLIYFNIIHEILFRSKD